ncbi:MAG: hypothetical protein LH472_04475, partial [Pyrinomonadaceae bacterium]|nr:hypothetical protein [Pyrinomonadaceae bacterium]
KRWNANGLRTLEEMKTDCCYAMQDKTWVEDPDGNRWEVFVVLGNTSDKDIAASVCCVPSPVGIEKAETSGAISVGA